MRKRLGLLFVVALVGSLFGMLFEFLATYEVKPKAPSAGTL